jgi:hypothetical protein
MDPDDDATFQAGIFYGQQPTTGRVEFPRKRRPMGQTVPPSAVEQIRELVRDSFSQALPPAMEEGAARIEKRYEGIGTLFMVLLGVTAVSTATIAVLMLLDHKW